ncbi:unnamed protein product [Victoria cruziana]
MLDVFVSTGCDRTSKGETKTSEKEIGPSGLRVRRLSASILPSSSAFLEAVLVEEGSSTTTRGVRHLFVIVGAVLVVKVLDKFILAAVIIESE